MRILASVVGNIVQLQTDLKLYYFVSASSFQSAKLHSYFQCK